MFLKQRDVEFYVCRQVMALIEGTKTFPKGCASSQGQKVHVSHYQEEGGGGAEKLENDAKFVYNN